MRLTTLIPTLALLTTALGAPSPSTFTPATGGWTVKNFTRASTPTDTTKVTYTLILDFNDGSPQPCSVVDVAPNALSHAWYGVPCRETGKYQLSWGWDYAGDFTVLTALHPDTNRRAYFGYSHPNVGLPGTVVYADQTQATSTS